MWSLHSASLPSTPHFLPLLSASSSSLSPASSAVKFCAPSSPTIAIASTTTEKSPWNPFQKAISSLLDKIEFSLIASLEAQHPLPSTADPVVQLSGNFAPVPEKAVQHDLEVEGKLPEELEGIYVRNGANPMFKPVAGHHLFDGDGMLHAIEFKQGSVSYCCRFTRTHRLLQEQKVGRAFFPKAIGELHGHGGVARLLLLYARSLFGLLDASHGMGVANAGVVFFNGHLLAMSEDDLPYAVKLTKHGDIRTIGRYDFNGQLASAMIAHPKIDPNSGELFALRYDVIKRPYLKYFKFSPTGKKGPDVTISLSQPTMMHDFAITENFVVIPDQQVVFRLLAMLRGGSPVVHDEQKVPRFGILPRDDTDEKRIKWIDVPDCFCFHLWNAWEEGEEIVVIGSCMTPADSIFNEREAELRSILSELRLNIRTGKLCGRRELATINLEAGHVNRNYLGRKTKYAYLAIVEPWPKVSGIAKVDLDPNLRPHDNVVGLLKYKEGCYGGEPLFVPRGREGDDEDEGYLLTFMHNEKSGESKLLVLDAKSPSLTPLASVNLPSRVPYGFHGTFITPQQLEQQS